jgi:uncharacterized Zn finger protein (UPF0148 family)
MASKHTTLDARYNDMIETLQKENGEEDVLDYILDTIPYIKEYTGYDHQAKSDDEEPREGGGIMPKKYKTLDRNIKIKDSGNRSLDAYVHVTSKDNRQDVLNRYLLHVEHDEDSYHHVSHHRSSQQQHNTCKECNVPLVVHARESSTICPSCGVSAPYLGLSEANLSYNEEISMQSVSSFSYKRSSHFQEYLSSIQCKEGMDIPQDVLDAVSSEVKKNRIKTITPAKVRSYLKKLRLSNLYDHSNAICMKLLGKQPPRFSPELEQQLKQMFYMVQAPFENAIKDTKRKNFLSYSYCLYKFFQLLGRDELLQYCTLLKDRQKLYLQDVIWKKITEQLNWQFIPSV